MKHVFVCLAVQTVAVFLFGEVSVGQWHQQNSGTTRSLTAVSFADRNHGFVGGEAGTILRTRDGGDTWLLQNAGASAGLKLEFSSPKTLW